MQVRIGNIFGHTEQNFVLWLMSHGTMHEPNFRKEHYLRTKNPNAMIDRRPTEKIDETEEGSPRRSSKYEVYLTNPFEVLSLYSMCVVVCCVGFWNYSNNFLDIEKRWARYNICS